MSDGSSAPLVLGIAGFGTVGSGLVRILTENREEILARTGRDIRVKSILVRDAARAWLSGEDRRIAPSVAKLFCTEMAGKVADLAVQVHGGTGYMREVPVERIYREVRLLRLYEGTSEIQRLIVGGGLVRSAMRASRS